MNETGVFLNPPEVHPAKPEVADTPSADAAESVMEDVDGLHTRYVEGPRPILNWQAGKLEWEQRNYRGPGMVEPFVGRVTLFRLLGWGYSREAAIAMAKENRRSNGSR